MTHVHSGITSRVHVHGVVPSEARAYAVAKLETALQHAPRRIVSSRLTIDAAAPGNRIDAHVNVNGYSEKGSRSTALTFDDQTRKSRRLGAGLQGKFLVTPSTQLFAEVAHEREFETDPQDVTIALNSVPLNGFTLEGYTPQRDLNRATLGISQKLTQDLSLRANYNWRKNDDVKQQGVNLAVSLDF